jgi:hypothetical protein
MVVQAAAAVSAEKLSIPRSLHDRFGPTAAKRGPPMDCCFPECHAGKWAICIRPQFAAVLKPG